jgi:hypothetical protein
LHRDGKNIVVVFESPKFSFARWAFACGGWLFVLALSGALT